MAYLADGEIGNECGIRAPRQPAARLDDIVLRYPGQAQPALRLDRLAIGRGERVALIGPSGGGKTTLLRLLNGTLRPTSGSIEIFGERMEKQGPVPRDLRRRTGMIFQDFALVERATVGQNVLSGRLGFAHPWLSLFGCFSEQDRRLAVEAIAEVGLLDKLGQRVDSLSGGQRQRVAIARVLAQSPEMILADEPVSHLDPALTREVVDLLTVGCQRRGATLVMAIHQPDLAKAHMERVIALRQGRVVFDADQGALTDEALGRIYDRAGDREPLHRYRH